MTKVNLRIRHNENNEFNKEIHETKFSVIPKKGDYIVIGYFNYIVNLIVFIEEFNNVDIYVTQIDTKDLKELI